MHFQWHSNHFWKAMVKLSSVRVAATLNHLFLKVSEDMNTPTSLLFILGK